MHAHELVTMALLAVVILPWLFGKGSRGGGSQRPRGKSGYIICPSCRNVWFGMHVVACPKCGAGIS